LLVLRVRDDDGMRAANGLIPLTYVTLLQIRSRVSQAVIFIDLVHEQMQISSDSFVLTHLLILDLFSRVQ